MKGRIAGLCWRLNKQEMFHQPRSIHVTFTAIVPGAYPGEAKMCQTGESGISPTLLIYYTVAIYMQLNNKEVNRKVMFGYLIS